MARAPSRHSRPEPGRGQPPRGRRSGRRGAGRAAARSSGGPRMTERLRRLTGGLPLMPLAVLFALFFFDEWDTAAFNVLAPNIQAAFHLSDRAFGLLVISNLSI